MKYTLLELTQNILSSMDSDEVDSILDTTEAQQVAEIIRTAYFNIITRADLPEHKGLFKLTESADTSLPVVMYRPDDTNRIEWIKYNKADTTDPDSFEYVTILPIQQFMDYIHRLNTDDTNVDTFTMNGVTFYYRTDVQPMYCTIIDDATLVFDSIDIAQDTSGFLDADKTLSFGLTAPTFDIEDSFTPDLDDLQFPLLLNEAKALASVELRQVPHESAERDARRQWRNLQRTKSLTKKCAFDDLPNFGRK